MEYLPFQDIKTKLMSSLNLLFDRDKYLFKNNVNERSISHMLALYLKSQFKNWDVDCEYNRNHENPKRIKNLNYELKEHEKKELISDIDGITVFPDIIVHHRGKKENLLVIEIKKSTSRVKRDNFDKKKLIGFCTDKKLKYRNAVFIKFKVEEDRVDFKEEIKWICKDGKLCLEGINMPTYKEIKAEVERAKGRKIHHPCWIAEVKRHYGLTRGPVHNTGTGKGAPPCPQWAWNAIEQILKNYGLI